MTIPLRVLSMGWGVQSFTLAAMAALRNGDLNEVLASYGASAEVSGAVSPLIHFAVHGDTTWERAATYKFARQWTPWLRDRGVRVFTKQPPENARLPRSSVAGPKKTGVFIPAFTLEPKPDYDFTDNERAVRVVRMKKGQLRRQCTNRWKIQVTRRIISMGLKVVSKPKSPGAVDLLLGISLDEFERARTSDVKYITNRFPLLDLRMTRDDCKEWLFQHGLPVPPKSSCVFCPYHNAAAWQELRQDSRDWAIAVAVDEHIRDKRPPYPLFVHPARVPLAEAVTLPVLQQDQDGCPGAYCFL